MVYLVRAVVVVFLLEAGLWFTGVIINGPNFHPKFAFGGPKYRRWSPGVSYADGPQAGLC